MNGRYGEFEQRRCIFNNSRLRSSPTWLRIDQYQKFGSLPKLFQEPEMAAIRP